MIRIRIKADQNLPRQTCKKACKASHQKDGNDQKHAIITKEKPNKMTCQSGQCNRNNGSFWCWEWSMINCYWLEIGFVLKLLFPKFVYTDEWKDDTCLLLVWIKPWLKEIGIIASTPCNAGKKPWSRIKDQGSESGSRSMIRIKSKTSLLSVWNYCVPAAECWIETMERRSAESVKSRRENVERHSIK